MLHVAPGRARTYPPRELTVDFTDTSTVSETKPEAAFAKAPKRPADLATVKNQGEARSRSAAPMSEIRDVIFESRARR